MEIPILKVLGIMLGLAVIVLIGFRRFKLPTIIGFLITGVIVGPFALKLVSASHEIEMMAEIGIILLLFIIGLEFSLKTLAAIKKAVILGGLIQVGLTILVPALAFYAFQYSAAEAVFIGFLMALSSTAIVLKILSQRSEISSPHGKIALAILIFQDIIVVPMMLFTPLIAGEADNIWTSLIYLLAKAAGVIAVVIISARYLVPRLLYIVAKTRNQELFILTIIAICIATAIMTSYVGLSLALGAFMAGLIISESEYSHQAIANVLPFREIFTSIFFISIGMLLDLSFVLDHLLIILGLTIAVVVVKFIIASLAGFALKYPPRTALHAGLILFQVGEFSFILSKVGLDYNILSNENYQFFLAISIISMAITPFVIPSADRIVGAILNLNISKPIHKLSERYSEKVNDEDNQQLEDHLIIIGYGINGKNVARAARYADIPYVIIELNADTVKKEKAKGEPIMFGDASGVHILEHAGLSRARTVVVAISDPDSTKQIIANTRSISQTAYLIIRTRFVNEIEENMRLGADEVIPEEFETSIQIFSRVLRRFYIPLDEIQSLVQEIREDNYEFLRPEVGDLKIIQPSFFSDLNVVAVRINQSENDIVGRSIASIDLRSRYGINLVSLRREREVITDITPDTKILNDDIVYVAGSSDAIRQFSKKVNLNFSN